MRLRSVWILVCTMLLASVSWAGGAGATNAAAAFEKLKSLAGDWEAERKDRKVRVTYEVVSGGSAVVERFVDDQMGAANEMVTVFHLDGPRLLLTHYCMAKNQPRMQARSFNPATAELAFDFLDATGMKSAADGHMHSVKFKFTDADHFSTEWRFQEKGETKFTENLQLTRVSSSARLK